MRVFLVFLLIGAAPLPADTLTVEVLFDYRAPVGNPVNIETRFRVWLTFERRAGAPIELFVIGQDGEAEKFCMPGADKQLVLRGFLSLKKTVGTFAERQVLRGREIIEVNTREDCTGQTLGPAFGHSSNPQNGRWVCIDWLVMPCRNDSLHIVLRGRQMSRVENIRLRLCPLPLRGPCAVGDAPVLLNEVMVQNSRTIADPQGDFDPWIEIYNALPDTFALSGLGLGLGTHRWIFPNGTALPGFGHLLVWADGDSTAAAGLHTNFRLLAGDTLTLFDADTGGTVLWDRLALDDPGPDRSSGRVGDGDTLIAVLSVPSPGQANIGVTAVRHAGADGSRTPLLFPNYPNPFNAKTRIVYALPAAADVTLCILASNGRIVRHLLRARQSAGKHMVIWNGRNDLGAPAASGLYLCQLRMGDRFKYQKLLLIR